MRDFTKFHGVQPGPQLPGYNSRSELLTNDQAATYLGLTPGTLNVWRCTKRHAIPYLKVGRLVKYRRVDLDAWLESRTVAGIDSLQGGQQCQ